MKRASVSGQNGTQALTDSVLKRRTTELAGFKDFYCLYFPDEGQYTRGMTFRDAVNLVREFPMAFIVDMRTAEVLN